MVGALQPRGLGVGLKTGRFTNSSEVSSELNGMSSLASSRHSYCRKGPCRWQCGAVVRLAVMTVQESLFFKDVDADLDRLADHPPHRCDPSSGHKQYMDGI